MTAVIYARYSSDNQREESIEGQIRECTAYAEKNGITVVKHYIDRAYSARTANRPEFQQMVKDSERRLFDIVLVWEAGPLRPGSVRCSPLQAHSPKEPRETGVCYRTHFGQSRRHYDGKYADRHG